MDDHTEELDRATQDAALTEAISYEATRRTHDLVTPLVSAVVPNGVYPDPADRWD